MSSCKRSRRRHHPRQHTSWLSWRSRWASYCLTITKGSCRHATAATLVAPSGTKDLLQPEILLTPVCTTLAGFVRSRTSRWSGLESAMPDAFQTSSYGSWTTLSVMRSFWSTRNPSGQHLLLGSRDGARPRQLERSSRYRRNVSLIAGSFTEFVAGLKPTADE
jgi:hypothetical protein